MSVIASLRTLAILSQRLGQVLAKTATRRIADDPETAELLRRAGEARRDGRSAEARALYGQALRRSPNEVAALSGLRDLAVEAGQWAEALPTQERIVALASGADRSREAEWLAVFHYELGREALSRRNVASAMTHLKAGVRADRSFMPAALALGDAHEMAGDRREAVRVWERAFEIRPALPVLARLERAHREEGRPSRMIVLYRAAVERAPEDLALAMALGRVYFELEMLDEAADQFEKVEVRAPDLPAVHAFLGAVFERRGQAREAFDEYRRALQIAHAFDWPHQCDACGARTATWDDRCRACGRWNTLFPVRGR